MKKSLHPKIFFILRLIFFFTSITAKISKIYRANKVYKNSQVAIKSINTISKEEEKKIIELIKTMNEAINYINDENISHEVKKQLIEDMIAGVSVINDKVNLKDDILIKELRTQYNNLNKNKSLTWDRLNKLYKNWESNMNKL